MPRGENVVSFECLADADLIVDQLYDGDSTKTVADDPIARLLPVGNQGGFRYKGSPVAAHHVVQCGEELGDRYGPRL